MKTGDFRIYNVLVKAGYKECGFQEKKEGVEDMIMMNNGNGIPLAVAWIIILLACLVIEAITVGLTTIWFAAGALAALIAELCGAGLLAQIMLFIVVSVILLVAVRPFTLKYMNPKRIRTNYEEAIGKKARVTAKIDNFAGTGTADLNGQEWTARSEKDEITFEAGSRVKVVAVKGVKLIVAPEDAADNTVE